MLPTMSCNVNKYGTFGSISEQVRRNWDYLITIIAKFSPVIMGDILWVVNKYGEVGPI